MSTHRQIFCHIIFGTKHRQHTIAEAHCRELYNYIFGIVKEKDCHLYRINGAEDHLHIFSDLHPSLSDYVKDIKVASSLWIKTTGHFPAFAAWQDGHGAFPHFINEKDRMIEYVKNQNEHHKYETFYDEYKRILEENGYSLMRSICCKGRPSFVAVPVIWREGSSTAFGVEGKSASLTPGCARGYSKFDPCG